MGFLELRPGIRLATSTFAYELRESGPGGGSPDRWTTGEDTGTQTWIPNLTLLLRPHPRLHLGVGAGYPVHRPARAAELDDRRSPGPPPWRLSGQLGFRIL